jgi:hypothetical protein
MLRIRYSLPDQSSLRAKGFICVKGGLKRDMLGSEFDKRYFGLIEVKI